MEKSSAVIGPSAFGFVFYLTGSRWIVIIPVAFSFIVGFLILTGVKDSQLATN